MPVPETGPIQNFRVENVRNVSMRSLSDHVSGGPIRASLNIRSTGRSSCWV